MNKTVKFLIALLLVLLVTFLMNNFVELRNLDVSNSFNCSSFENRLEGPLMGEDPQLVSYLYSKFLKPPSNLPYNLSNKRGPSLESKYGIFYPFLSSKFKDMKNNGFFVEAGALDGEAGSNTLALEYYKNWTGLLIEPYEPSCKVLESKHRKAWTSCSSISPKKYAESSIFEIPHTTKTSKLTLFRANVRNINSFFHTFKDIIQKTASSYTYSRIQGFPLITYLLALNITKVDLLSLDTQGGEKSTLFNFPFDKVKVDYMLIEYFIPGPRPTRKDEELVSYLQSKDFDLIKNSEVSGEYVFKNKNW